jgi:hypothetical protein
VKDKEGEILQKMESVAIDPAYNNIQKSFRKLGKVRKNLFCYQESID